MTDESINLILYDTIHGWALSPDFFTPINAQLQSKLSRAQPRPIDLGFLASNIQSTPTKIHITQPDYIIAHSLGGLWALYNKLTPKKGIIFINSFSNFSQFIHKSALIKMQKGIGSQSSTSYHTNVYIKSFLERSDCAPYISENQKWKTQALIEGLEWLKNWDASKHIQTLQDKKVRILALAGQNDLICPVKHMQKHWQDQSVKLIINPDGGHALPASHPDWCAQQIISWINEE